MLIVIAYANYSARGLARRIRKVIKLFNCSSHRSSRKLILSDSVTENATVGVVI